MNYNDTDLKKTFGRLLAERRQQLKLTQEQLADRCGSVRNYIGELERGEKQATLTTLFALADALETTPAELMQVLKSRGTKKRRDVSTA